MNSAFILMMAAAIIHPRLNTEDSAITMFVLFTVIWVMLPSSVLMTTPIIIVGLCINIRR